MYDVKPVTTKHHTACGPACLKMLLAYYGHDAELEALISECGVTVHGCTAKDVLRVGRAHGLNDFAAYSMDADALMRQDRPAIIYWKYTHFVVFCGMNAKGEPVICNPSMGRFPLGMDAFRRFFSGVALCVGRPEDEMPEDYFGEHEPEPDYFNE